MLQEMLTKTAGKVNQVIYWARTRRAGARARRDRSYRVRRKEREYETSVAQLK